MTSKFTFKPTNVNFRAARTYTYKKRWHRLPVLEHAAKSRLPGYLDRIKEIGEFDNGGYWLTAEQELELRSTYNPSDLDGIAYIKTMLDQSGQFESRDMTADSMLSQVTSKTPCKFIGCEEMKKAYEEDVRLAGGENCTNCELGKIKSRYKHKIQLLLK